MCIDRYTYIVRVVNLYLYIPLYMWWVINVHLFQKSKPLLGPPSPELLFKREEEFEKLLQNAFL